MTSPCLEGGVVLADAVAVLLEVEGDLAIEAQIDALVARGHVDADRDLAAHEGVLERGLALARAWAGHEHDESERKWEGGKSSSFLSFLA